MKNTLNRRKIGKLELVVASTAALASSAMAAGEPLDLTATGTTIAAYVATGAAAGLGIFAAKHGVRVIIAAFKSVGR